MGIEIIVLRKDPSSDKFFLKDIDKFKQVFRVIVAYVIDLVWWNRQTAFTGFFLRSVLHYADYAFNDIVNIGEITLAVTIVEDLYLLAFDQLIREAEISHVRASGRSLNSEEAKACRWDIVQLAVGMCHQFVTFLSGGIEAHRIIHLVIC